MEKPNLQLEKDDLLGKFRRCTFPRRQISRNPAHINSVYDSQDLAKSAIEAFTQRIEA